MKIHKSTIISFSAVYVLLINLLFLLNSDPYHIRTIITVPFLLFVPGMLVLLFAKIQRIDFSEYVVYAIGLSVTLLIIIGLGVNTFFPYLGVTHPLDANFLLIGIDYVVIGLLLVAIMRVKGTRYIIDRPQFGVHDWFLFGIPILFPILSCIGALTLNNGGTDFYTMVMLGGVGIYVFSCVLFHKQVNERVFPMALLCIALALLLMTSLRGWYVTGHDNQLEQYVFNLTHAHMFWNIADYRDPYNASLSITILPTIFASLLRINPFFVYKIVFQLVFAFIGVSAYLFFRKFADAVVSFLAVIACISFPSFVGDMPMLNRQEIALLFFSLMLLVLYSRALSSSKRMLLFSVFGIAMALAHYSTTYIAIALFGMSYVVTFLMRKDILHIFSNIHITVDTQRLRLGALIFLIGFTYLWNVQVTQTIGGLQKVVAETIDNIGHVFSQDLKSNNVLYTFFNLHPTTSVNELDGYIAQNVADIREGRDQNTFYPEDVYSQISLEQVTNETAPLTRLGDWMQRRDIDVFSFQFSFRQIAARLVQVFIVIGGMYLVWKKMRDTQLDTGEYLAFAFAALFWIGTFLILPILSVEYGTQRLFQQMLLILGLPLVVGLQTLLRILFKSRALPVTAGIFILFFLSFSGFLPQLTGGYYPQLHLNNSGIDYGAYYTHDTEVASARWLSQNYSDQYDIYSSSTTRSRLVAVADLFSYHAILPQVIRRGAYVYVTRMTFEKGETIASYNGDLFVYTYPVAFLDDNKDLIYANGGSRIYK